MKDLGRFFLSCIIVFLSVVLLDVLFGKCMQGVLPRMANTDVIGKTYYTINVVDEPNLIVGSSRASHHYISKMMEDTLGISIYNAGRDGCFYSDNICILNSILDRYSPKLIIWECSFDSFYEDASDPLQVLYPYYGENKWVTEIISNRELFTALLPLKSSLYKYNSEILRYAMLCLRGNGCKDNHKGYQPLTPKRWVESRSAEVSDESLRVLDDDKVQMLENMLVRMKWGGVRLIIVNSPVYTSKEIDYQPIPKSVRDLLEEYDVLCIDNRNMKEFIDAPEYFNDNTHLNDKGASLYTQLFINQLIEYNVYR